MNLRGLLTPTQPRLPWRRLVLAALGVALIVAVLGLIGDTVGIMVLFVGFAPSCLLVFTLPEAPVSQPIAVLGGQLVSSAIGIAIGQLLSASWWSIALGAGLAVAAMVLLRIIHPPAVANTVVAIATGASWSFLLLPVLAASLAIVLVALIWHRLTGTRYPVSVPLR